MPTMAPDRAATPRPIRKAFRSLSIPATPRCHAQQFSESLQFALVGLGEGAGVAALQLSYAATYIRLETRAELDGRRQFYDMRRENHDELLLWFVMAREAPGGISTGRLA
jgi:hypothetical protein